MARIARDNVALQDDRPPASLAEVFDRLEQIRATHTEIGAPTRHDDAVGDLESHLAFLERSRELRRRGKKDA
jgi:hypothetical protein